jgi:hypothetical protein
MHFFFGSGQGIAGAIYGTIVVMAVVVAGSVQGDTDAWRLAGIVATTVLALWIAHVYAHGLSESIQAELALRWEQVLTLARREASVLLAAVGPIAALLFGGFGLIGELTGIRLALGVGVTTLAVHGFRYARLEHLSRTRTLIAIAANITLGLLIVAVEVAFAH